MSDLAEEVMQSQGKYRPVESKRGDEERRRRIGIAVQDLEDRVQRPQQEELDGRYQCGYGASPGSLRFRSKKRQGWLIQDQDRAEYECKAESEEEPEKCCP